LRLLRIAEPVAVPGLPVTLYPCPLRHRVGLDDPTAWISNHPRTSKDEFRIGIAHGSLHVLPQLPEDDHLIAADAAERLDLDYLALGHWHKPFFHGLRTAYPGTHEPMRFPDETSAESSGWQAYGPDKNADRFQDAGQGSALQVELSEPTAAPRIQQVYVSQLTWRHEHLNITDRPPGQVIKEFTSRANVDSTLLHLRLSGVVNPQELRRFDELRELVINRFAPGSRYEADEVLVEADGEELRAVVGDGVLRRVFERLQEDAHDPARMAVARRALKLLYQLAWEDRPA